MKNNINTTEIEVALYNHFRFLQNDVMTNIYLDYGKYECDLIVIRKKSLLALEVEIKTSLSDLKAERKKHRYQRYGDGVNGYHDSKIGMSEIFKEKWFAMPKKIKNQGLESIPNYAGLLIINDGRVEMFRKAKILNNKPLTQEQRTDLLRLGVMKCYQLKKVLLSNAVMVDDKCQRGYYR